MVAALKLITFIMAAAPSVLALSTINKRMTEAERANTFSNNTVSGNISHHYITTDKTQSDVCVKLVLKHIKALEPAMRNCSKYVGDFFNFKGQRYVLNQACDAVLDKLGNANQFGNNINSYSPGHSLELVGSWTQLSLINGTGQHNINWKAQNTSRLFERSRGSQKWKLDLKNFQRHLLNLTTDFSASTEGKLSANVTQFRAASNKILKDTRSVINRFNSL